MEEYWKTLENHWKLWQYWKLLDTHWITLKNSEEHGRILAKNSIENTGKKLLISGKHWNTLKNNEKSEEKKTLTKLKIIGEALKITKETLKITGKHF